jgi:hypothetical protein
MYLRERKITGLIPCSGLDFTGPDVRIRIGTTRLHVHQKRSNASPSESGICKARLGALREF